MRIGVLTICHSYYGLRVLNALRRAGQRAALVVVVHNSLARKWQLLRRVAHRIGWLDAVTYAVEYQFEAMREERLTHWRGLPLERDYHALAESVLVTPSLNTLAAEKALRRAEVDVLLLGQSGIVPGALLAVPRYATFNAHPGWLPDYRGIDCHKWALYQRQFDRVGSSLHAVDAKIDTGALVLRQPYCWQGNETTGSLLDALYEDCVNLLLAGVARIATGEFETQPQTGGRYYYKMPRRLLPEVEANLRAHLRSGQWAAAAGGERFPT